MIAVTTDTRLNSMQSFYYGSYKHTRAYPLSDIDFKDFKNISWKCTAKPFSFSINNTTLPSNNALWFRSNLLENNLIKH